VLLPDYLPILLLGLVAVAFAAGSLLVASFVGPRAPNPTKLAAYESVNIPQAKVAGSRFSVKFYLVAMLFVIFDIELILFFPWAVVFAEIPVFALSAMGIFIAVLLVALGYEWRNGGLEWD
jgi:NADH-quinone oxidoreductase subunit A